VLADRLRQVILREASQLFVRIHTDTVSLRSMAQANGVGSAVLPDWNAMSLSPNAE
jgi:hypothetical protein